MSVMWIFLKFITFRCSNLKSVFLTHQRAIFLSSKVQSFEIFFHQFHQSIIKFFLTQVTYSGIKVKTKIRSVLFFQVVLLWSKFLYFFLKHRFFICELCQRIAFSEYRFPIAFHRDEPFLVIKDHKIYCIFNLKLTHIILNLHHDLNFINFLGFTGFICFCFQEEIAFIV